MSDITVAIVLHVLGVVWWVGGMALVTTVVLPHLRRHPDGALERFHAVERRFAPQVRVAVLTVGASGGWMLYRLQLWRVLGEPAFWWLWAMIALWTLFFLMLFVLGPTGVLRRIMSGPLERDLPSRLARMHYLHMLLLGFALVTVAGGVAGVHG
ncbi:hypothetical protein KBTX_02884 [wastewater metagenome]|uniref:Copper resistance protein D domain-containing protein n=2 Tax=unclassified sequences TaxID=12908 RepID=A0A5B8RGB8_9ZZZZ|nr:hypothetical protein [Arhodomonas sp. KWT]QEA06544.1 hypothetical protein KBTEX_02884 [uncultured organism]